MTVINPIDHEDAYNSITLGGVRSPGKVTLSGHDRKVGWDVKKGSAQSGASMSLTSEDPVAFTATFELLTAEDWEAWPAFLGLINSTVSGAKPKALDVYHPDLVENLITSVVKDTNAGTQHDGKGGQIKVVKLIEYKPPKPKGGSPTASKTKPQPDPNDPNAAALRELDELTNKYKAVPWKFSF